MYTPPCSSPTAPRAWRSRKRAALALVCAWDGKKPVASPLPFYLTSPMTARRARRFMSPVTIRW